MEFEDKESTETGSLSGNSETESPPGSSVAFDVSGGVINGIDAGGGLVVPPVVNIPTMRSVEVRPPGGGPASGGAMVVSGGGGSGDFTMGKKKRGRPRKYDADGNLRVPYISSPPGSGGAPGFSFSSPSSGEFSSSKRGRGKAHGSGSSQLLASLGELFANTAGADFTPHVVTVHKGEDVAAKILSLAYKGPRGVCILSANGTISNVTIRQPGSSGGLLTYEGRFEILTLTGSFTISANGGMKSRTGGLSVSLAGPDGRVVGGGVAGVLLAASPIQIVVGSFMLTGCKTQKRKPPAEPRMAPLVQSSPDTAAGAMPVPHTAALNNISRTPMSQFAVQSHGDLDNRTGNGDKPNSTYTNSVEYNNSGPNLEGRSYPDINVSISME